MKAKAKTIRKGNKLIFTNYIERVNSLVEMALDFDDADSIITEFWHYISNKADNTQERLNYLYSNFNVAIIGGDAPLSLEEQYRVVLTAIVDKKWR
jgi:hypothetical protein